MPWSRRQRRGARPSLDRDTGNDRSERPRVVLLPDGLVAVVKADCPTCRLVEPVLRQLANTGPLTVVSQDDPAFPVDLPVTDDRELELSWRLGIETVPTLLRVVDGAETDRLVGWLRGAWEEFTGVAGL